APELLPMRPGCLANRVPRRKLLRRWIRKERQLEFQHRFACSAVEMEYVRAFRRDHAPTALPREHGMIRECVALPDEVHAIGRALLKERLMRLRLGPVQRRRILDPNVVSAWIRQRDPKAAVRDRSGFDPDGDGVVTRIDRGPDAHGNTAPAEAAANLPSPEVERLLDRGNVRHCEDVSLCIDKPEPR